MALRASAIALCVLSLASANFLSPEAAFGLREDEVLERVDLSGDGGATKLVLAAGEGAPAAAGQTVRLHYHGKLAVDGKEIDSSHHRGGGRPLSFRLGENRGLKGWDLGVASMRLGERAVLVLKPECERRGGVGAHPRARARASSHTRSPPPSARADAYGTRGASGDHDSRGAVHSGATLYYSVELLGLDNEWAPGYNPEAVDDDEL